MLQVNTSLSHYKDSHQYVTQEIQRDTQNSPKFRYHQTSPLYRDNWLNHQVIELNQINIKMVTKLITKLIVFLFNHL